MEYCFKETQGERYAKAQAEGLNVSYKDLVEICKNIRGRRADSALSYLEGVSLGETAVRYYSHNKKLGHRHELFGRRGRYPRKAAKAALSVLENAIANANSRGLSNPKIAHACANKGQIYGRMSSKGRSARSDYENANLQIVLREAKTASSTQSPVQKPELPKAQAAKIEAAKPELSKAQKQEAVKQPAQKQEAAKTEKPTPAQEKTEPKKAQAKPANGKGSPETAQKSIPRPPKIPKPSQPAKND